jgi:hyperosmotically inducible periplasmic protein
MKLRLLLLIILVVGLASSIKGQDGQNGLASSSSPAQARIQKEVRHELLMLPYFGVFDNIAFRVSGNTVTLLGQVTRPTLKSDAENTLKHIEGVEHVDNRIEVLPPSPMEDRLRLSLYNILPDGK